MVHMLLVFEKTYNMFVGTVGLSLCTADCKTTEFCPLAGPRSFPHQILMRESSKYVKLIYDLVVAIERLNIVK